MQKINSAFVPFFNSKDLGLCLLETGRRHVPATKKDEYCYTYATPAGEYATCPMLDVLVQWHKSTTIDRYLYKVNPDGTLDHTDYYFCTHMEGEIVWKHISLR